MYWNEAGGGVTLNGMRAECATVLYYMSSIHIISVVLE
jgi:hypothetical protein